MSPKFRTRSSVAAVADTPERLYDELPREAGAPDALWAHQADVLRAYHSSHLTTPDVALELPTGAGKTLPGLLIAEWRRRSLRHRVLYACPTQQLARQAAAAARKIGIDAAILVGSHHDWTTVDKLRYEAARDGGHHVQHSVQRSPGALEPAQTLLFDDAHAAEQFVAGAWSVEVNRFDQPKLYQQLLEVFGRRWMA